MRLGNDRDQGEKKENQTAKYGGVRHRSPRTKREHGCARANLSMKMFYAWTRLYIYI